MKASGVAARLVYGALFALLLPAALVLWARATTGLVRLPPQHDAPAGTVLLAGGLVLALAGMRALWVHGGGLPMNAFLPPRHVAAGAYRLVAHPIYVGFVACCAGAALLAGSASGLWLVTPAAAAACAALVLGHERHDLHRRFGDAMPRPWLSIAPDEPRPATASERLAALLLVHGTWFLVYEGALALGRPAAVPEPWLPGERDWPVWVASVPIYASIYVVAALVPLLPRTARDLRELTQRALLVFALAGLVFVALPFAADPRPIPGDSLLARVLAADRAHDGAMGALPSLHPAWALLAAFAIAARWPRAAGAAWCWAAAVAVSCLTTGQHALLDVLAGLAVYVLAARRARAWEALRAGAERVANSWREWRVGPLRIINHGAWAGLAGGAGLLIADALVGPRTGELLAVCGAGLLGAGLWAQFVEGSPGLLRPFGYYGGVLGIAAGGAGLALAGRDAWPVLAALGVAGPWIQALGRMRCLVQGCCHGRPSPARVGLRYRHPRSRVVRLAELRDVPVHATPLYSILACVASGALLARLWAAGAPLPFVVGAYLFLNGVTRFVEESFRGEPQTPRVAGLPIYQWNAVVCVLAGAALTALPGAAAPAAHLPTAGGALAAAAFGLLAGCALGVDVPDGRRRFSRLA